MLSISSLVNMMNMTSTQSVFSLFNAIQLFLLLPLIGTHMPDEVIRLLINLDFCLCSFSFLSLKSNNEFEKVLSDIDYEQTNSYLTLLDLESASAFVNILNMAMVPFLFVLGYVFSVDSQIVSQYLTLIASCHGLQRISSFFSGRLLKSCLITSHFQYLSDIRWKPS